MFQDLYGGDKTAYLADFRQYFQEGFVEMALDGIQRNAALDKRSKNRLRSYVEKLTRQAMADAEKTIKGQGK